MPLYIIKAKESYLLNDYTLIYVLIKTENFLEILMYNRITKFLKNNSICKVNVALGKRDLPYMEYLNLWVIH